MNLVSCDNCAVVLDISKIPQTAMVDSVGNMKFIHPAVKQVWWDGEEYQLLLRCPVCKNDITIS